VLTEIQASISRHVFQKH